MKPSQASSALLKVWLVLLAIYPVVWVVAYRVTNDSVRKHFLVYVGLAPFSIGLSSFLVFLFWWAAHLKAFWVNAVTLIGFIGLGFVVFLGTIFGLAPFLP